MMSVRKCLTAWVKDIAATREKRAHVKGMLKRVLNGKLTAAWKQLKGYMNELKHTLRVALIHCSVQFFSSLFLCMSQTK